MPQYDKKDVKLYLHFVWVAEHSIDCGVETLHMNKA